MAGPPVSRRALLFGLGRERPADYRVLGRRLEPAAERLVRASGAGPGRRILDVLAGDGNVSSAAARAGAEVVSVGLRDVESLPFDDTSFDCVVSNFGIIHARDTRRAVDEIDRVLRPGGSVVITAWASAGVMGRILRLEDRRPDDARAEWWGRYEGVQLAFSRFPGFDVEDLSLHWEFESEDELWEELPAPRNDRLRELVEPSLRHEGEHVVLDVGYVLVVAHKPDWA